MSDLTRVRCIDCDVRSEPRPVNTTPDGWLRYVGPRQRYYLCPACRAVVEAEEAA